MRIVMIGPCYPLRGGLAQFGAILARQLARRHTVLFLSFKRQYPGLLFPGKTQFVPAPEAAAAVRFPAEMILDSIGPWSWWRTARRAAAAQPDLVLIRYWMPFFAPALGTLARLIRRRSPARIVYLCDNVIPHERTRLDRCLTRYALSAADAFLVMSAAVRDDLLAILPDARWKLVPHPVYTVFGERGDPAAARRGLGLGPGPWLLFFGYVRAYKGLDLLIEALPEVRRSIPARLLVAGEFYDDEQRYRAQVRRLGLQEVVRFDRDYIPEDRVAQYFAATDVVVLPYHSATQSGIVPVAYQLDSPVICTDVGGLSEVVTDGVTGFVVPPEDPHALAAAIVRFYREDWAERLRAGVRAHKQAFGWEPFVAAVEELGAMPPKG